MVSNHTQVEFLAKPTRCAIIQKRVKDPAMKKSSPLIRFILLNILVSAVTTLAVLWIWEIAHPRPTATQFTGISDVSSNTSSSMADTNSSLINNAGDEFANEDIIINIRTIVGAGNIDIEYVEIINQGENPANLTNWQLVDEGDQTFTFPTLILNKGGAVKIFSRTGTNTVIELYWQSDHAIWQSGETALLLNSEGEVVTTYSIP